MSTPRLVAASGLLVDVVLYVPHLPVPGGDVLASTSMVTTGGVFNVLAAARRQGLAVAYLGAHGTGRFGDQIRADLAAEGVAVTRPPSPRADSGFCVGLVDDAAERTYATASRRRGPAHRRRAARGGRAGARGRGPPVRL